MTDETMYFLEKEVCVNANASMPSNSVINFPTPMQCPFGVCPSASLLLCSRPSSISASKQLSISTVNGGILFVDRRRRSETIANRSDGEREREGERGGGRATAMAKLHLSGIHCIVRPCHINHLTDPPTDHCDLRCGQRANGFRSFHIYSYIR